jgi:hypothetical protein
VAATRLSLFLVTDAFGRPLPVVYDHVERECQLKISRWEADLIISEAAP